MNPALLYNHIMFIVLYLTGFFLEKKPCTICSLVRLHRHHHHDMYTHDSASVLWLFLYWVMYSGVYRGHVSHLLLWLWIVFILELLLTGNTTHYNDVVIMTGNILLNLFRTLTTHVRPQVHRSSIKSWSIEDQAHFQSFHKLNIQYWHTTQDTGEWQESWQH